MCSAQSAGTQVNLPDGRTARWEGFQTGPRVLSRAEIGRFCRQLLRVPLAELSPHAGKWIQPERAAARHGPAIILHSATSLKKDFETSLYSLYGPVGRIAVEDPSGYGEARSVYLAGSDDLVVGRVEPWQRAIRLAGVRAVDVGCLEYYYLSHALLKLAGEYSRTGTGVLDPLIRWLRAHPAARVMVYALDEEMLIFLLWLRRTVGLPAIRVDANAVWLSRSWAHKTQLHPWVMDVTGLSQRESSGDSYRLLSAEHADAPFWRDFGLRVPVIPGYTIRAESDAESVFSQLALSARFLVERYGLRIGCSKPSRGGAGSGIRKALDLRDVAALRVLAREVAATGEDCVLEAHLSYLHTDLSGHRLMLAPSAHIEYGRVADGATLQFLRDVTWQGNIYIDESCHPGLSPAHYDGIRSVMNRLVGASFNGEHLGLIKAGLDFGIGRLGGRFGTDIVLAVQDLNPLSTGAEYLRTFLNKVAHATFPDEGSQYAATKVVRPSPRASLDVLTEAILACRTADRCEPIASVPGQWAMIAVSAPHPGQAVQDILAIERDLKSHKLVV